MKPKSAFCSSSSHPQRLVRLECWLSAMLLALQATTGWAANGTWTNTWGSQWTNTLCWSNGVVANGVDSIADFSAQNMATNYSITLNGDRTNGNLYIGDTTSPYFAWTLIPGTGGTLTLQVSSNQPNIIVSKGNGAFINVPLASTNGFVKDGTNTLTLNCVNTDLTSNILIKAGVLKFGSGSAGMLSSASSIIVTNGSQLILNGHTQTLAGIFSSTSANNRITGGSVTPSTLTVSNGIYSGVLGGTNANDDNLVLVKTGTNTLTLGGVNTLTNLVLINGGSLQLGAGTTGTLSLASSITVTNNAQLLYVANTPVTNSAPLALTGTGATATGGIGGIGALGLNGVGALYQNGTITLAPTNAGEIVRIGEYSGANNSTINLNGNIIGSGSLELFAQGNGYNGQFFLNTNFHYTGGTALRPYNNNLLVTLGVNDALPPTTVLTNTYQNMTFANFSQLILNGYTQTLAGIFSVANTNTLVTNRITGGSTNSSMLTVSNAVAYTYNGILGGTNANDNNLALVKAGTNTLTLTRANTYTNWTTISNGTLLVNGSLASKEVTVATGATLGGTGTVSGTIKVSGIISSGSGGSGQLNAGNVTWSSGTTASSNTDWVFKLASGQTNLHMTGQFTKGNGSVFRFDFAGSTSTGTFVLADGIIITNFNATDFSYVNLGPGGGGRAATFQITDSSTKLQVTVVKTNFSVEAYGAITNDPGDAAPAIRRAIQAAIADGPGSVVSFQPGMYRISLDTNTGYCLNMAYANGLSLQGSNTTLIVTDPLTGGLRWLYGTNCSVSGITLDYAPLHFTQGTITNINPNAGTFDVIVDADYPLPDEVRFTNQWGMIMDQTKSQPTQKAGTVDQVRMSSSPTNVSGRTYRFTPENTNVVRLQIAVSNRFVYIAQYFRNGFYFQTCTNFLVANVTVNAAPGASISQLGGEGMQVRNCSISVPAGSGRLLAAGGGIGCKWARKGPVIADNYFEATHDDIVDILSTPTPILQVASSTSITVEAAASLVPILSGDRIQVLDPVNGSFRGEATATNVVLVGGTNYQLTLDVPISGMTNGTGLSNSDSLYNLSASGKDYVISNNVINPHRARGLLLHSSGIVISNRITGASMSGILVDNESGPAWWEGPVASGITIRSNIIDGCGYADPYSDGSIRIASFRSGTSGKFVDAKGICVRDIIIQDNIITNWATVAIHASSVSNLSLINNQIQSSDTVNSYIDDIQGMVFENARAIVLSGGTIIDPRTNLHAGIHVLNTVWQSTNGFRTNNFVTNSAPFFSLATNIVPNIPNILDDRNTNSPLFVFVVTPSIAPIPTQTIMSGSNLVLSITATPQPLNFNLFSAPTGAVIDKVSGVFTWRPSVAQAGTNQVVVDVRDNGSLKFAATQTFQIIVTRPPQPEMSSVVSDNGQFCMSISGQAGLDYILQTTTNLDSPNWVGVWTNYSAVPPLVFTNNLTPNVKQQFYRVLLGP